MLVVLKFVFDTRFCLAFSHNVTRELAQLLYRATLSYMLEALEHTTLAFEPFRSLELAITLVILAAGSVASMPIPNLSMGHQPIS